MNQQTTKGYVYLLISQDKNSFKIGKSNEVNMRLEQLNKHWQFNLIESIILEVNKNNTINIERLLHRFLKDFRLKGMNKKDGYTEFFNIKALEYIDNYIQSLKILHDIKQMNYIEYCKKEKNIKSKEFFKPLLLKNTNLKNVHLLAICLQEYFKTKENKIFIDSKIFRRRLDFREVNIDLLKDFIKDPFNINSNEYFAEIKYTNCNILFTINEKYIQLLNSNEALSLINYDHLLKLNSIYSQRLYFHLTQLNRFNFNKNLDRNIVLSKNEFKEILIISKNSYPNINDFKRRILNVCIEQINAKTDLNIDIKLDSIKGQGNKKDTIIIECKQKENKEEVNLELTNSKKTLDISIPKIEKQKPLNNPNYFKYTNQPLINTSF